MLHPMEFQYTKNDDTFITKIAILNWKKKSERAPYKPLLSLTATNQNKKFWKKLKTIIKCRKVNNIWIKKVEYNNIKDNIQIIERQTLLLTII